MARAKKKIYSFWVANQKTLKNLLITWGPAAIAFLCALQGSVPAKYATLIGVVVSYVSYLVKNTIANDGLGWIKKRLGW